MTTLELLTPHLEAATPIGELARNAMLDSDLPTDPHRLLEHLGRHKAGPRNTRAARDLLQQHGLDGGFCHD